MRLQSTYMPPSPGAFIYTPAPAVRVCVQSGRGRGGEEESGQRKGRHAPCAVPSRAGLRPSEEARRRHDVRVSAGSAQVARDLSARCRYHARFLPGQSTAGHRALLFLPSRRLRPNRRAAAVCSGREIPWACGSLLPRTTRTVAAPLACKVGALLLSVERCILR
jgi:hypothetical protein